MEVKLFCYRQDILSARIGVSILGKLILSSFLSYANKLMSNVITVAVDYYAKVYGTTEPKVINTINKLHKKGLVKIKKVGVIKNGTYLYTLELQEVINEYFPNALQHWDNEDEQYEAPPKIPFKVSGLKGTKVSGRTAAQLLGL